ncbi:EamA-like transporter family protein [Streptomyces sp. KS_5]|nr:EamA-like transporter family protein [Streptomyces sp. KS_5]
MTVVLERTAPRTAPIPKAAALGIALAALATVVWSGSFVTSRALAGSVPPVQQAFWRWLVALAVVAPFGARQAWRQRAAIRLNPGFVLLASLLGVTGYNTLVNQAGSTTPAANMGMIMAASPVLMAVFERASGVRLGGCRIAGLLVACAGVVLLIGGGAGGARFAAGDRHRDGRGAADDSVGGLAAADEPRQAGRRTAARGTRAARAADGRGAAAAAARRGGVRATGA